LLGEQFVFADIRRDHLLNLPRLQQQAQTCAVDSGIVRHDREILHTGIADRNDQRFGDTAKAETSCTDQHAVLD